ncbi:unnamed protein product [Wickerhamomyces anomalus]
MSLPDDVSEKMISYTGLEIQEMRVLKVKDIDDDDKLIFRTHINIFFKYFTSQLNDSNCFTRKKLQNHVLKFNASEAKVEDNWWTHQDDYKTGYNNYIYGEFDNNSAINLVDLCFHFVKKVLNTCDEKLVTREDIAGVVASKINNEGQSHHTFQDLLKLETLINKNLRESQILDDKEPRDVLDPVSQDDIIIFLVLSKFAKEPFKENLIKTLRYILVTSLLIIMIWSLLNAVKCSACSACSLK